MYNETNCGRHTVEGKLLIGVTSHGSVHLLNTVSVSCGVEPSLQRFEKQRPDIKQICGYLIKAVSSLRR